MNRYPIFFASILASCSATDDDGAASETGGEASSTTSATSTTSETGQASETSSSSGETSSSGEETGTSSGTTGDTSTGDSEGSTGGEPSESCATYCELFLEHCNAIAGIEAYRDAQACYAACAPWPEGTPGAFTGNTVQCRIAHLTFDPNPGPGYYELHCFHVQENPTSQCI